MPISVDRLQNIRRAARVGTTALFMLAAAEVMVSPAADTSANANRVAENSLNAINPQPNFFGVVGSRLAEASSDARDCLTRFVLKIHARAERAGQDVTGVEVTLFNTTNPNEKAVLRAQESQNHDPNKNYQNRSFNPITGENSVLLRGDRLVQAECRTSDDECPKTEIGAYESVNGVPVGPVTVVKVDCPPRECYWQANWAVEQLPPQPTATATATQEPTKTPMPTVPPNSNLPRTGN